MRIPVPLTNAATRMVLALLSGVLLALPYLYAEFYVLGWFAFVPVLVSLERADPARAYRLGLAMGLAFYLVAAYWAVDFIQLLKGYELLPALVLAMLFWLYSAQLPALVAVAYVWLARRLNWPSWLLFALVATTVYSGFPMLVPAQLAESQSHFLSAIQAVEFTGAYGLDFVMAVCNVLLARWLIQGTGELRRPANLTAIALLLLWFGYGALAQLHWREQIADWDSVALGLVQPDEQPHIGVPPARRGFSRAYPPEMALSEKLAEDGAELIVWPESRYKGYFRYPHVARALRNQVSDLGIPLLFQDHERVAAEGQRHHFNTALLLDAEGRELDQYRKIKRIAFGEYLPLADSWSLLDRWARDYLGGFYANISQGSDPALFETGRLNIVPLICLEVLFPRFTAAAVNQAESADLLVTISNNGWFGTTREPYQQLYASVLRAAENRLPLVHVVNNGPSAAILPDGRIHFESDYHHQAAYRVEMPHRSAPGGSFFSRHPWLFLGAVYTFLALAVGRALLKAATLALSDLPRDRNNEQPVSLPAQSVQPAGSQFPGTGRPR